MALKRARESLRMQLMTSTGHDPVSVLNWRHDGNPNAAGLMIGGVDTNRHVAVALVDDGPNALSRLMEAANPLDIVEINGYDAVDRDDSLCSSLYALRPYTAVYKPAEDFHAEVKVKNAPLEAIDVAGVSAAAVALDDSKKKSAPHRIYYLATTSSKGTVYGSMKTVASRDVFVDGAAEGEMPMKIWDSAAGGVNHNMSAPLIALPGPMALAVIGGQGREYKSKPEIHVSAGSFAAPVLKKTAIRNVLKYVSSLGGPDDAILKDGPARCVIYGESLECSAVGSSKDTFTVAGKLNVRGKLHDVRVASTDCAKKIWPKLLELDTEKMFTPDADPEVTEEAEFIVRASVGGTFEMSAGDVKDFKA